MALTFADTHNMISFLTKSDASEGFNQIVDFLNAYMIQYALMIGKGFLEVDTPLFDGMLVPQQVQDVVEDVAEDEDGDHEVTLLWMIRRMHPNRRKIAELDADEDVTLEEVDVEVAMDADVQGRLAESQAKVYHRDLQHDEKVLSMQDTDESEPAEVEEVIKVVTVANLMTEVVTTAATTITVAQVPKASALRRRKGVVIQDTKETATTSIIVHFEVKSKDKGKGILVEEPKPLKR
nr:hypothetical protein [Tanacetum cinerariifolium]